MCNLEHYKSIQLFWKSNAQKSLNLLLTSRNYNQRGLLVFYFDATQNAWVLKDQFSLSGVTLIPLHEYNGLNLNFADVPSGQTLKRFCKPISPYNFHLFTSNWNTPKFDPKRQHAPGIKPVRSEWFKKPPIKRQPLVEKRLTVAELQKDPLVLKKSKYRYATKAFYAKQSDFPRSKWIRTSRLGSLTGSRGHFSLSYSYSMQHTLFNFLQWKFDISLSDLQSFRMTNRMTTGSLMNNLSVWLLTRLPHVLVSAGFCHTYTAANKLITSGQVKVNGLTITDINYCIKIGDSIVLNTLVRPTKFKDNLVPSHLLVNWKLSLIVVKSNLTLTSSVVDDLLMKSSLNLKRKKVSGNLKNPMSTFVWRMVLFVRNLSH
jgi:hypothetical protein